MVRRAAVVILLMGVAACLAAFTSPALAADERITSYRSDMTVGGDGALRVRERISYDFGSASDRHGIVRLVPREKRDGEGRVRRYDLTGVRVSSPSGANVGFTVKEGRDTEIRIGDPSVTVTGRQVYVIDYVVAAALTEHSGHDELSWDVLGDGWRVPISDAAVSVTLPVPVTGVSCSVGTPGSRVPCRSAAPRGNGAEFAHPSVTTGKPLAIVVKWRKGAIAVPPPAYAGGSTAYTPLAVVIGSCLLIVPLLLFARGLPRGRARGVPAHASPPGVRPGEVGMLLSGQTRTRDVAATLVDLANRGHLRVQWDDGDYLLVRNGPLDPPGLAPYEAALLKGLFTGGDEVSVRRSRLWVLPLQRRVRELIAEGALKHGWFRRDPVRQRKRQITAGWVMLGAAPFVAVGIGLSPMGFPNAVIVTGFLVGAAVLTVLLTGRVRPLTREGSRVLGQLQGLRDHIKNAEDPDGPPDRIEPAAALLPYAVAFGLAYIYNSALVANEVALPDWIGAMNGEAPEYVVASFVAATERSYAASMGGGSGGGGGGGGGYGGSGDSGGGGGGGSGSW